MDAMPGLYVSEHFIKRTAEDHAQYMSKRYPGRAYAVVPNGHWLLRWRVERTI